MAWFTENVIVRLLWHVALEAGAVSFFADSTLGFRVPFKTFKTPASGRGKALRVFVKENLATQSTCTSLYYTIRDGRLIHYRRLGGGRR